MADQKRKTISFAFLVLIGLVIGIIIKRVHVGLIIGLGIGLLASVLVPRRK